MPTQFNSLYARATQLAIDTNIKMPTSSLYFDNNLDSNDNVQIPKSITNELKNLTNVGIKNQSNLNKLVNILESGEKFLVVVHQQINLLLQQKENNSNQLDKSIANLLASLVRRDNPETTVYKQISNALLQKLNDVKALDNKPLIQQSLILLKQISRGVAPDVIKDKIKQILTSFKENTPSLPNLPVSKELKVLLQKLLKESHSPHSTRSDMQLAKELAELILRLNQQITENEKLAADQVYRIQQQQQKEQQQSKEEQTDEDEIVEVLEKGELCFMPNAFTQAVKEPPIVSTATRNSAFSGLDLYKGDNLFSSGLAILFLFMDMLSAQSNTRFLDMEKNSEIAREAQKLASAVDGVLANVAAQGKSSATGALPADVVKYIEENHLVISNVTLFAGDLDGGRWTWKAARTQLISEDPTGIIDDIAKKNNIHAVNLIFIISYANKNAGNSNDYHWETNFRRELKKLAPTILDKDIDRLFKEKNLPNYNQGDLTAIKGALDNKANSSSDFISTSQLQLQKLMQTYNVCVSLINSMQTMLSDMNKMISQGVK